MTRLDVRKTLKLFVGGSFTRSESGRTYEVVDGPGAFLANAARASRKDVRDAVTAAHAATGSWGAKTAFNRGQILYRIAEIMESRRTELIASVEAGQSDEGAVDEIDEAIDRWVWYAGLTDKLPQITGGANPVAGPYFNLTVPEPIGVVALVPEDRPSLLGLVSRLAPALCAGNTIVALASESNPLPAVALAECLATSDVPGGVVNILTGQRAETLPVVAGHLDIDAIDVSGVAPDDLAQVEELAADNVKRVIKPGHESSPYEATAFMEMKTVWHTKGA